MQFVKGMFGGEFDFGKRPTYEGLDLRTGQMRCEGKITHNSGWYNARGEKLGWGDLSVSDFRDIQGALDTGDVFVVLSESDSHWNFVTRVGVIGSMCEVQPTADAPGVEYVAEHAMYLITPEQVYFINQYGDRDDYTHKGMWFKAALREWVTELIRQVASQVVVVKQSFGRQYDAIPSNPVSVRKSGTTIPQHQYLCSEGAVCVACGIGPTCDCNEVQS